MNELAIYDEVKRQLAIVDSPAKCKEYSDKLTPLKNFFVRQKNPENAFNAAELSIRFQRKGGELLKASGFGIQGPKSSKLELSDFGINKKDSHRYQQLNRVPEVRKFADLAAVAR